MERKLNRGEQAYKNMEAVARMLEATSRNGAKYVVKDTFLDYGQGWEWTTICRRGFRECQVLCPRDWKTIFAAETIGDLAQAAETVKAGKYFND